MTRHTTENERGWVVEGGLKEKQRNSMESEKPIETGIITPPDDRARGLRPQGKEVEAKRVT